MTTTDTRSQLLREIAASPDDDTLRLAFADWLDEHGDPADADRAEFIRTQFSIGHPDWLPLGRTGTLFEREAKLLAAHPEWSRCRCPRCNGRKGRTAKVNGGYDDEWIDCSTCDGAGDLFLARVDPNRSDSRKATDSRTVKFARGFPNSVTCTLAEAFAPDGTPTAWAIEVVRQTPVVRFRMTDVGPRNRGGASGGKFHGREVWDWSSAHTPGFLMDEMAAANPRNAVGVSIKSRRVAISTPEAGPGSTLWWVEFAIESEARDALALAAGRLVRRHTYKGKP